MRWSEARYLSQFVLTHALRQVSVSLILGVRQKNMIFRTRATFSAQGASFRPSLAKLPFSSFQDVGALGDSGRYRGVPLPYGVAYFEAPQNTEEPIRYLHREIRPILSVLKELGADSFSLHITYDADSGALGFSANELRMIAELECDMPIDLNIQK
jgi:hypothetical protein